MFDIHFFWWWFSSSHIKVRWIFDTIFEWKFYINLNEYWNDVMKQFLYLTITSEPCFDLIEEYACVDSFLRSLFGRLIFKIRFLLFQGEIRIFTFQQFLYQQKLLDQKNLNWTSLKWSSTSWIMAFWLTWKKNITLAIFGESAIKIHEMYNMWISDF